MSAGSPPPLNSAIFLRDLTLQGFRGFKDGTRIDFTRDGAHPARWTIILGENGTGKTALLQAIGALRPQYDPALAEKLIGGRNNPENIAPGWRPLCAEGPDWFSWWDFNRPRNARGAIEQRLSLNFCISPKRLDEAIPTSAGKRQADWYSSTVIKLTEDDDLQCIIDFSGYPKSKPFDMENLHLLAYGLGRGLTRQRDVGDRPGGTGPIASPEPWLLELHHASKLEGEEQERAQTAFESAKRCVIAVLPDIEDIRIRKTDRRVYADPSIRAEFLSPYGWVLFEQLGLGYQSIASWTIDLLRSMHVRYEDLEKPETGPAVALIDEFDLHLHPRWQLTLMEHLGKIFSNTQFIITVHSPLVVQAAGQAPDTNLVLLQRVQEEGGVERIVADNHPVHVRGWRLDQIVTSDLFGMDSARPPEFANLFKERSDLVAKSNRTKAEDKRLEEITRKIEKEAPPSISQNAATLISKLKAGL